MSATHNRLATLKLTDENRDACDARAELEAKAFRIPVSRARVANEAIAIGIKIINKRKPNGR